jgi:hypothetical protein
MKKILATTMAGAFALAGASAAQAAVTVDYDDGQFVDLELAASGTSYSGSFAADVIGTGGDPTFTASFSFFVPGSGQVSIAGISILTSEQSNINFYSAYLDGTLPFFITNGVVDQAVLSMQTISAGSHTFQLNGFLNPPSGEGTGSLGGSVSFALAAAVPEPATWALFILGFGAIGATLRRRSGAVRVRKAELNFA